MTDTYQLIDGKPTITKDPGSTLDYSENWAPWLARINDTISQVTVATSAGITYTDKWNTATACGVTVSGGQLGALEWVKFTVTTTGGKVDSRTIYLSIVSR
jgi:hypothetical protein